MGREGLRPASGRGDASQRFGVAQQSIDPVAANPSGMNSVLVVHLVVGILVAACAALLVWWKLGRRIVLYLLTLQIALGVWAIVSGHQAPPPHYALAVLAWIGYMAANSMSGQPDQGRNVMILTVLSSAMVLLAAFIGARAAGY
jgi:hypothetical protein